VVTIASSRLLAFRRAVRRRLGRDRQGLGKVDYEGAWDDYARTWRTRYPRLAHLGDEWTGEHAGAAASGDEYRALIESRFIVPYIEPDDDVLEIGVGGGKTAALLSSHCRGLTCADISAEMLKATRERLGDDRVRYVKLDGIKLSGVRPGSIDVCFSFDTMVHMEPRDIFNYLTQIPGLMRGKRLCVFHHGNTLSELGWKRFMREWDKNLMGRAGGSFSVMTIDLMAKFFDQLGYVVVLKDSETIPRDCVWVVRSPEPGEARLP
jgi:SAM-dependent methyltransferase